MTTIRRARSKFLHLNSKEMIAISRSIYRRAAAGFHLREEWEEVKRLCGYRCLRCDRAEGSDFESRLTRDHVIALSRGGDNWITNIQPLCRPCNNWKANRRIDYRNRELQGAIKDMSKPFVQTRLSA